MFLITYYPVCVCTNIIESYGYFSAILAAVTGTSDLRFNHSDLIITRLVLYVHFSRYNATIAMWCDSYLPTIPTFTGI